MNIKPAQMIVDKEKIDGVLIVVDKDDSFSMRPSWQTTSYNIPTKFFVHQEPAFFSDNYAKVDELLNEFRKSGAKNLLSVYFGYINDFYAVGDMIVNFYQPTKHFDGDSVWVRVLDKNAFEEIAVVFHSLENN